VGPGQIAEAITPRSTSAHSSPLACTPRPASSEIRSTSPWHASSAPVATQGIDLWFGSLDTDQISLAAQDAGGFWISGFGMQPPAFGGDGLSRIDVVLTAHGLGRFADEYAGGVEREIEGVVGWKPRCGHVTAQAPDPGTRLGVYEIFASVATRASVAAETLMPRPLSA
jgi:hypothetical protein